jgi:hypothetical protein
MFAAEPSHAVSIVNCRRDSKCAHVLRDTALDVIAMNETKSFDNLRDAPYNTYIVAHILPTTCSQQSSHIRSGHVH